MDAATVHIEAATAYEAHVIAYIETATAHTAAVAIKNPFEPAATAHEK